MSNEGIFFCGALDVSVSNFAFFSLKRSAVSGGKGLVIDGLGADLSLLPCLVPRYRPLGI